MEVIKLKVSQLSVAPEPTTVLNLSATKDDQIMFQRHGKRVLTEWESVLSLNRKHTPRPIILNGKALSIPEVVAAARYESHVLIHLSKDTFKSISDSVQFLQDELDRGHSIYGVNTGFGGSADTSTLEPTKLQEALLQMQLSAVLPITDSHELTASLGGDVAFSDGNNLATLSMPQSWVRAAMLVRCNSLIRGHSAVRIEVLEALSDLLRYNIVPLVPLRGSISASGDLCPLSYIAGALAGNPDIRCWVGASGRRIVTADAALHQYNLSPIEFRSKETLGILNGTAISAAVATLAQHQADNFMLLAQVATAMGVEALLGTAESFDAFFAAVRSHNGQKEVAENITAFLKGSQLVRNPDNSQESGTTSGNGKLRQDRYALRTASQWLGPYVEDLSLARQQLETELNATTDNPIFDVAERKVLHGGNFQAVAVTSSTEKTRLAVQMIGKMIFAQSSELLDNHKNNGLPPNLAVDEPSLSFTMKGVDINMAAYMSELAHLANPVSSHVQSAEMHNQAINSLALVSTRYTHMALDVLSLMFASHLYTLCQALDLRVMNMQFLKSFKGRVESFNKSVFENVLEQADLKTMNCAIWVGFESALEVTTSRDSLDRFSFIAKSLQSILIETLTGITIKSPTTWNTLQSVSKWSAGFATLARVIFNTNRASYLKNGDASQYLGPASKRMYQFIRNELKVPFHRGLTDHPTYGHSTDDGRKLKNTGSQISIIYHALRNETLIAPTMECLRDALSDKSKL